jgi:RNA polymerase sigma-70 factor (ECF subfamily)
MVHDSELITRVQIFDQKTLAEVYDTYSPALYRYAMRLLGDQDLAEDCVADTFMRFLQAVQQKKGPRDYLQAYLYRMAHNWIVDFYRSQPGRNQELKETRKDGQDIPEDVVHLHQKQNKLREVLRHLTADQLQVITLKYFEGWDFPDISKAIGKPIGAVKALQHRALVTLRNVLKEENFL